MRQPRVTPDAVLTARRQVNAEGHRLTYRRLASLATEGFTVDGVTYADSADRAALLRQAADQFLRTKRSKALGHVNGDRRYSTADRLAVHPKGSASLHGRRPSTTVAAPRRARRSPLAVSC